MNGDLIARLNTIGEKLHRRAGELEQSGQQGDIALLMQGLAVTLDAVNALGRAVDRVDGPSGLGGGGEQG